MGSGFSCGFGPNQHSRVNSRAATGTEQTDDEDKRRDRKGYVFLSTEDERERDGGRERGRRERGRERVIEDRGDIKAR